jgi:hypothetical protein
MTRRKSKAKPAEATPPTVWAWLRPRITLTNYLLLSLPMWALALVVGKLTHSSLPYNVWAVLWAAPMGLYLAARWIYFLVTLIWAILIEIAKAVRKRIARPD